MTDKQEEIEVYCKNCDGCGEDPCCSALHCAYQCMVEKSDGKYCYRYYHDIEFAYKMFQELYDTHPDENQRKEIFDKIWDEVYGK